MALAPASFRRRLYVQQPGVGDEGGTQLLLFSTVSGHRPAAASCAVRARCVLWAPPVLAQGPRTSLSRTTQTPLGPYLGRIHSPLTLPLTMS